MSERVLLGLVGAAGAGKDTVAEYLISHKDFKRFAFADRIKQEYYKESGVTEEEFKSVRGKPREEEIRTALWAYSDRMKAEHGSDHFIALLMNDVASWLGNAVVTDIRTLDEMSAVRRAGGKILLLLRLDTKLTDPARDIPGSRLKFGDIEPDDMVFINDRESKDELNYELAKFYDCYLEDPNIMEDDPGSKPESISDLMRGAE